MSASTIDLLNGLPRSPHRALWRAAGSAARAVRLITPLLIWTAASACAEKITAPQAEAILRDMEALTTDDPWDPNEQEILPNIGSPIDRLWDRMGIPGFREYTRFFDAAPPVLVSYSGVLKEYRGFVLERLTVPHDGGRGECGGPRWSLLLWRGRAQPEGILLVGGRFDTPAGPIKVCEDVGGVRPEPGALAYPPPEDPDQHAWMSRSGSGYIEPGRDVGHCWFLAEAAVSFLADNGVTCSLTRHTVQMTTELRRTHLVPTGSQSLRLNLARTEVPGVRWTIDCEQSRKNGVNLCQIEEP